MRTQLPSIAGADAPVKQSVFDRQLMELEKRASCLIDTNNRVSQAICRLLNPRPAEAETKTQDAPAPHTIEGRLNLLLSMLDVVQQQANDNANDLDSAF